MRVSGTGTQVEHWSLPRTAPGRKRAEACVRLTCAVSWCMAAMSAGCGSGFHVAWGGGVAQVAGTRYRTAGRALAPFAHCTRAGQGRGVCASLTCSTKVYFCFEYHSTAGAVAQGFMFHGGGGGRGQAPVSAEGKGHQSISRGHAATEHCESKSVRHGDCSASWICM